MEEKKEKFLIGLGALMIISSIVIFVLTQILLPVNETNNVSNLGLQNGGMLPNEELQIEELNSSSLKANTMQTKATIASDGAIICDSIVEGVKNTNLSDGDYVFRITGNNGVNTETIDYPVEIINFYDDVHYSLNDGETTKTVSLGDTTTKYKMLVVKYHKNLTIDKNVTVTATNVSNLTYKKGMYLCVMGELVNNGTISMTARGTYNVDGENVYLWKNTDNTYEFVPASGATGLPDAYTGSTYQRLTGAKGNNGQNRGTGGGGRGGYIINTNDGSHNSYIGGTTGGSSYSGGNGGGGMVRCNSGALSAAYTRASKASGGPANAYDGGSNTYYFAGGGAGQVGGASSYCRIGSGNTETKGHDGTGGLLILYTDYLKNDGTIVSNGSNGAGAWCYVGGSYNGAVGRRRLRSWFY